MGADQTRGGGDEIRVVACPLAIRQQRNVFQADTNAMASLQRTLIDGPTRDSITVVNLLERDARGRHDVLHRGSMLNGGARRFGGGHWIARCCWVDAVTVQRGL